MANVADYIIQRLATAVPQPAGKTEKTVDTLFGVPAWYCSYLYDSARSAGFTTIVTSSDLEAGYAADGYARVRGLSLVAVSYGPGTLSLVNAIAGAYVERSPIVVINGGPSRQDINDQQTTGVVFSHSIGKPHTDLDVFAPVTAFCERVEDIRMVPAKVDAAIQIALTRKRPVYLEIPREVLQMNCARPSGMLNLTNPAGNAAQVADTILKALAAAKSSLLIVGVEVQRYGLAAEVLAIIDKLKIRWMTTLLERTTINENHRLFRGVYNGDKAPSSLVKEVADADLIVSLGAVFGSNHDTMVSKIKRKQVIRIWDGNAYVMGAAATAAGFESLISELKKHALAADQLPEEVAEDASSETGNDKDGTVVDFCSNSTAQCAPLADTLTATTISYDALFQEIERSVTSDPNYILIADTFLGIHPAARIAMTGQDRFMANAIWASIGHSVGAGTGVAAANRKRPFVVCGDGGFQMIVQSLSTMARFALNAIVVVVDNTLYGYEQYLLDRGYYSGGSSSPLQYALLNDWDYIAAAKALGIPTVLKATTAAELASAISNAKRQRGPAFIQVSVGARSLPTGL